MSDTEGRVFIILDAPMRKTDENDNDYIRRLVIEVSGARFLARQMQERLYNVLESTEQKIKNLEERIYELEDPEYMRRMFVRFGAIEPAAEDE